MKELTSLLNRIGAIASEAENLRDQIAGECDEAGENVSEDMTDRLNNMDDVVANLDAAVESLQLITENASAEGTGTTG